MSEGYRQSQYTNATSVRCDIVLQDMNEESDMMLDVYEFAPFITSPNYCLSINGRKRVCSGSAISKNHIGYYKAGKQWTLEIDMKEPLEDALQVRFWLHIFIGQYIFIKNM